MRRFLFLCVFLFQTTLAWGQRIPGQVEPSQLNAANAPVDALCLTYLASSRQFNWLTCAAGGSGDNITVNGVAAVNPDFLNGDIDWTLGGPGTPITATVGCTDCVTLTTETVGSYAAGDAEAGNATGVACTDCIALTTETSGNYVSSATVNEGLLLTGTEAASLGFQDCAANEILKRNAGDTAWACAVDATGGTINSFETIAVPAGTAPVADLSTDTLTLTETSPLVITGTAATDTIDMTWSSVDLGADGTIQANAVALTTDTTGSYAAGDAEAGNATGLVCTDCVGSSDIAANVIVADDVAATLDTHMLSYNLEDPAVGDDGNFQAKIPDASTLARVSCSTTSGSAVIQFYERAENAPNTGITSMLTANLTCDADTIADATTAFADSAVAADAVLALGIKTDSTTGVLRVFVEYTIN